jgi:hypothetical protein
VLKTQLVLKQRGSRPGAPVLQEASPLWKANTEILGLNRARIALLMEAVTTSETRLHGAESHFQCHRKTTSVHSRTDRFEWQRAGGRASYVLERHAPVKLSRTKIEATERWDLRTKWLLRTALCERHFWGSSRHWIGRTHHYHLWPPTINEQAYHGLYRGNVNIISSGKCTWVLR